MLSLILPLLLTQSCLVSGTPVKNVSTLAGHPSPVQHEATTTSSSVQKSLKPSAAISRVTIKPYARHRLYRSNRFTSDGREMTREEFDQMLEKDPEWAKALEFNRKQAASMHHRRGYLRDMIKKNPDQASQYIREAKEDGFQVEDVIPGGQDRSPEAFKKRQIIRANLSSLKKDIARVGTPDQKTRPYYRFPVEDIGKNVKYPEDTPVEDQLLHEVDRFRAAIRIDPYDQRVLEIRDRVHVLMKRSLSKFSPINLPYLSRVQQTHDASASPSKSSRPRSSTPAARTSRQGAKHSIRPPTLDELKTLKNEEKKRYIRSLFDRR